MGRQRQVWLIPIADERVGVQVKLWDPLRTRAIPERFWGSDSRRCAILRVCMYLYLYIGCKMKMFRHDLTVEQYFGMKITEVRLWLYIYTGTPVSQGCANGCIGCDSAWACASALALLVMTLMSETKRIVYWEKHKLQLSWSFNEYTKEFIKWPRKL